jgi:hypothetical protein
VLPTAVNDALTPLIAVTVASSELTAIVVAAETSTSTRCGEPLMTATPMTPLMPAADAAVAATSDVSS